MRLVISCDLLERFYDSIEFHAMKLQLTGKSRLISQFSPNRRRSQGPSTGNCNWLSLTTLFKTHAYHFSGVYYQPHIPMSRAMLSFFRVISK